MLIFTLEVCKTGLCSGVCVCVFGVSLRRFSCSTRDSRTRCCDRRKKMQWWRC